jgi:hypothetical protein
MGGREQRLEILYSRRVNQSRSKRTPRHKLFAAPFVVTAVIASAACAHDDARPVEVPETHNPPAPLDSSTTSTPASASASPNASPSASPSTARSVASLPDAPSGADVQKKDDGTCVVYERSNDYITHCPKGAMCNPGPPREVPVKCPSDAKKK